MALRDRRPYLFLLAGRLVTNAGDSIYYVTTMWLVYELTGSTWYTGVAGALVLLPDAFQFLAGPLVDARRLDRVLAASQGVQALLVLVVPALLVTGRLSVEMLLLVVFALAVVNQVSYPAEHALVPLLVADDELVSANSALRLASQGTEFVFNAVTGALVAVVGAAMLYVADAVTFAVAFLLFGAISYPESEQSDESGDDAYLARLWSAVSLVRGSSVVAILVALAVVNLGVGLSMAVLPAYASAIGGPATYGFLLSALAGGMLAGSLLAMRLKTRSFGRVTAVALAFGGCAWAGSVAADAELLTVALFGLAWVPVGVFNVMVLSLVQSVVPDQFIGRVSSLGGSVSQAAIPVGSLLGGAGGAAVGARTVLFSGAVGLLVVAVLFGLHRRLRVLGPVENVTARDVEMDVPGAADGGST